MSDEEEEVFYDSLEEDNCENGTCVPKDSPKNIPPCWNQISKKDSSQNDHHSPLAPGRPRKGSDDNDETCSLQNSQLSKNRKYENLTNQISKKNDSDSPVEDLTKTVPLYHGEISKNKITSSKKKAEKPPKPITCLSNKPKKSYLTMYYEKVRHLNCKTETSGSNTSRAFCEKLSPRRDLDLEPDLKELETNRQSDEDSGQEEFYEKFMALELENKKSSSTISSLDTQNKSKTKFSSCSSLNVRGPESRFLLGSCGRDSTEKLELLKKRQSYGTKMSMKNRIRIEELKSLKKIKISKLGQ